MSAYELFKALAAKNESQPSASSIVKVTPPAETLFERLEREYNESRLSTAEKIAKQDGITAQEVLDASPYLEDEAAQKFIAKNAILFPAEQLPPSKRLRVQPRKPRNRRAAKHDTLNNVIHREALAAHPDTASILDDCEVYPHQVIAKHPPYEMPAPINHKPARLSADGSQLSEDDIRQSVGLLTAEDEATAAYVATLPTKIATLEATIADHLATIHKLRRKRRAIALWTKRAEVQAFKLGKQTDRFRKTARLVTLAAERKLVMQQIQAADDAMDLAGSQLCYFLLLTEQLAENTRIERLESMLDTLLGLIQQRYAS